MLKNYPICEAPDRDHELRDSSSPREQLLGMLLVILALLIAILLRSM